MVYFNLLVINVLHGLRWSLPLGLCIGMLTTAQAQFTYSFTQQTGANDPLDTFSRYIGYLEFVDIDNDGDRDMLTLQIDSIVGPFIQGTRRTRIIYENQGTDNTPLYRPMNTNMPTYPNGIRVATAHFGDLDGDGDLDMVRGTTPSSTRKIEYAENTGTQTVADFVTRTGSAHPLDSANIELPNVGYTELMPTLVDIDNDGDLDCFIALKVNDWSRWNFFNRDKVIAYYENIGNSTNPIFTFRQFAQNPLNSLIIHILTNRTVFVKRLLFVDEDGDGDLDITCLLDDATIQHWINTGSPTAPNFVLNTSNPFANWNALLAPNYGDVIHIDRLRNGFITLITSEWYVGPHYFEDRMIGVKQIQRPLFLGTITTAPNPSTTGFTVNWEIPTTTTAQWQLVNTLGQTVQGGRLEPQQQQLYVPTAALSKGSYWMIIQNKEGVWQQKVVVQ